jgi:hypothetical protein
MASDAEFEQAGLYDPEDPHAAERHELLHYLVRRGATLDDLVEFRDELPAVAIVIALRHGDALTVDDLARRSGVDRAQVVRIVRACGFTEPGPDERAFSEGMARLCALVPSAVDLFGDEAVFQLLRVMGASSIRLADALVSSFLANVEPTVRDGDGGGLEVARANASAIELFPEVVAGMDTLLRQHLVQLRRPASGHEGGYETRDLCVGFIDLVDSTELARDVPMDELGTLLADFERGRGPLHHGRSHRGRPDRPGGGRPAARPSEAARGPGRRRLRPRDAPGRRRVRPRRPSGRPGRQGRGPR